MNGLRKFWDLLTADELHLLKETGFSVNFSTSIELFFVDSNNAKNQIFFIIENDDKRDFVISDKEGNKYSYSSFKEKTYEFLLSIKKEATEKEKFVKKLMTLEEETENSQEEKASEKPKTKASKKK
jgi:lipopolysaccharide export LptBFGC system permease protein LptF